MRPNSGDLFCVYNDRLKKYTACQIVKLFYEQEKEKAALLVLDWMGDELLAQSEFGSLKPLIKDFFYWEGEPELLNVDPNVPADHIFIGNTKPLLEGTTNSYGDWNNGYFIYRQVKWNEIDEKQRQRFKDAVKSEETTMLAGQEVPVRLRSISDSRFVFQSAKELAVLPCLSTMKCEKWHDDLYAFLESNPFIDDAYLRGHKQKMLDFRGSYLRTLKLEMDGVEEVYLNDEIEELVLLGNTAHAFQIHAKEDGALLRMNSSKTVKLDCGLKNLSKIHCGAVDEIDLSEIVNAYPNLTELRLWGKPGYIRHFSDITLLRQLQGFTTVDMFGFTANDIPQPEDMPNLDWFWMSSLPDDAAKAAKRLYKKRAENGLNLWIQKARKPEWLKENLDNPFRSWDGQENITPTNAKKAATQYKETRKAILQLVQNPTDNLTASLTKIVMDYTEAFNRMDKRKYFIETVEREDIYTVLCGLLNLIPADNDVDKNAMLDVFDEHRDF